MPSLSDPIRLGAIAAPNRVLMAPLTRARSTPEHVPVPLMAEYYAQRAGAGLIISEATGISQQGLGWPWAPGIWSDEQIAAWRPIVEAVHAAGGRIVSQLWHMGRLVHPDFIGGGTPVSSSATTAPDHAHTYEGKKPYAPARALRTDEIPGLLDDYARAARNAMEAGFDGIQLHAANGYLIDQFLRDGTNLRDDAYGGPPTNRVRLLAEVAQRLVDTVGGDRVGVRLSPNGAAQGCDDSDPHSVFPLAAETLDRIGIAWLELREPRGDSSFRPASGPPVHPAIRKVFTRPLALNSDYDTASGEAALAAGEADAISYGRPFIANPDLPRRVREGLPFATPDPETLYFGGAQGYVDYPRWDQRAAAE